MSQPLAIPPALRPGDGISIVAPASPPRRSSTDAGLALLTAAGYRPKTYRDFCAADGYLAGTDEERAAELETAFADPDTSMVLAVRGGYGCGRILDRVDFSTLAARPKIVCGYSDLTALHAAIQGRAKLVSFHGPNLVGGLGRDADSTETERAAAAALFAGKRSAGDDLLGSDASIETITGGTVSGHLIGGNLAVLMSLLGTPDEPPFDGGVLLLEDTGEVPYRVDRLLTQLRTSGRLGRIAGAVLGYFSKAESDSGPPVEEVLAEFFASLGVPVLAGVPIGHEHPNLVVPLGASVHLDADQGRLKLGQAVISA